LIGRVSSLLKIHSPNDGRFFEIYESVDHSMSRDREVDEDAVDCRSCRDDVMCDVMDALVSCGLVDVQDSREADVMRLL
jgi:hypothetical protein